ncbi:MAG TPA: RDD family protein, partial [Cytophagales bacterium]
MQPIRIQTAQNVFIEYQPASVGDRILATLIDWVVAGVFVILLQAAVGNVTLKMGVTFQLLLSLPYVFYHFLSEV